MSSLFITILFKPLFNVFVGLYNIVPGHDVGVVILVITVLIRLILYPLTNKSIKSQKALQELQPKMEEIKKQYAGDQQKQAQATMELYRAGKVNPMASCLPLLIQLPILIALYWVFSSSLNAATIAQTLKDNLYPFISNPGSINPVTMWTFNLAVSSPVLAVLAGLAQYLQARTTMKKTTPATVPAEGGKAADMTAMMNKQMLYFMPALTVLIGFSLPAGLTFYWFWSTLLMAGQQFLVGRASVKK